MSHQVEIDVERVIRRARGGDRDALGLLLEHYRSYLRLLARLQIYRRLQGKADSSDIVQETFLQAGGGFENFRGQTEAELLSWLRRILASQLCMLVRRYYGTQLRNARLERDLAAELDRSSQVLDQALVSQRSLSPSSSLARREQAVLLADALDRLPEEHREVIILHHLHEFSFTEVAKRMQTTPAAVRSLWMRALTQMKKVLGDRI